MKRAVFLDRDGVINQSIVIENIPKPPQHVQDVKILSGVIEAIQFLKAHNFLPVVVTNQPDVSRGVTSIQQVEKIHDYIKSVTAIEHFYTCFHDDLDQCLCRKPLPGLITKAAEDLNLDASRSYLVGDRWRDIAAGNAAGCTSFFIDYSYAEISPTLPYIRVNSLLDAVKVMIGDSNGKSSNRFTS